MAVGGAAALRVRWKGAEPKLALPPAPARRRMGAGVAVGGGWEAATAEQAEAAAAAAAAEEEEEEEEAGNGVNGVKSGRLEEVFVTCRCGVWW